MTEAECSDPGTPPQSTRSLNTITTFKIGQVVVYECVSGTLHISGSRVRRCMRDGSWLGAPITCSGKRHSFYFMILVNFCIMSYWFVTFRSFISYWRLILCEYQPPCSMKPLFSTRPPLQQNVEQNDDILKFSWNFPRKATETGNEDLRTSMWKEIYAGILN